MAPGPCIRSRCSPSTSCSYRRYSEELLHSKRWFECRMLAGQRNRYPTLRGLCDPQEMVLNVIRGASTRPTAAITNFCGRHVWYHFVEDHISPQRAAKRRGPADFLIRRSQVRAGSSAQRQLLRTTGHVASRAERIGKPPLIARRTNHFISINNVSLSP